MAVRQRAFELMEAVLRAGLVAPWTAVPHMVALSTDPSHALAQRARRVLRLVRW
jgi:cohesin loading factor subunit SCC2